MKLTVKQKEALYALLFDRKSTQEIQEKMQKDCGLLLSQQAISYHRRKLLPELQTGDLEAVQSGVAAFPSLVASLAAEIQALHDSAVIDGKLSRDRGAAFSLMVVGQLRRELRGLLEGAHERQFKREQHEARLLIEQERLKIERERWELEKFVIEREKQLMGRADAAEFLDAEGKEEAI